MSAVAANDLIEQVRRALKKKRSRQALLHTSLLLGVGVLGALSVQHLSMPFWDRLLLYLAEQEYYLRPRQHGAAAFGKQTYGKFLRY